MNFRQSIHRYCLFRATILTTAILLASLYGFGQTVYVTNTGTKYHRSSCQYLSKSKIPMQADSASEAGYSACSVCKPSANSSTGVTDQLVQPDSQTKLAIAVQCKARTKAGNRCSRSTKEANGRCWQHQWSDKTYDIIVRWVHLDGDLQPIAWHHAWAIAAETEVACGRDVAAESATPRGILNRWCQYLRGHAMIVVSSH
jgi:hypothetical protein